MRAGPISRTLWGMKLAVAVASVLLVACGDNREPTLGDYAADLGRALEDKARSCAAQHPDKAWRYGIDAANAEKFADRFCAFRDAHDDFLDCAEAFEFDLETCLDDLDALGCVNVSTPENCPRCGFASVPESCRAMWDGSFQG